ncbi:hypothetical protein MJ584_08705 [Klebsiella pneumoniae]|nr:hypothetical protein MJ584_08705 [Klebsiella pneumoniae]
MFLNVFAGQTAADASAFDGRWVKAVFSQQTTWIAGSASLFCSSRECLLTLRRSGRFRIGFPLPAFFTCAVAFAQAAMICETGRWRPRLPALHPEWPMPVYFQYHFVSFDFDQKVTDDRVARFFVPATVASATDSGRSGTRISTLLIVYPLINRRSARH